MFILDDILLFPVRAIHWIACEVHDAAQQELAREAHAVTAGLGELYTRLETGKIAEAEFAAREKELLDRLDRIQERVIHIHDDGEEKKEPALTQSADVATRSAVNP